MIAALYVARGGCYFNLPDVDPWDEERDARLYAGPWPVVAHPPCARWCRLAGLVEARYPRLRKGDDGGTFAAALAAVKAWGGVLEHPAFSDAWAAHDMTPPGAFGWTREAFGPGWVAEVSQAAYGHRAQKLTWLYYVGRSPPQASIGHALNTPLGCRGARTTASQRSRSWGSVNDRLHRRPSAICS